MNHDDQLITKIAIRDRSIQDQQIVEGRDWLIDTIAAGNEDLVAEVYETMNEADVERLRGLPDGALTIIMNLGMIGFSDVWHSLYALARDDDTNERKER